MRLPPLPVPRGLRPLLTRWLPAEIARGFEVYGWSVGRMLEQWWARRPWERARARLRAEADRLRRAERYEEAIVLYRRYLAARPDHAMAWLMLAFCLRMASRSAEAAEAYERALALAPEDPFVLVTAATFHRRLGDEERAGALFARAAALGGGSHVARAALLQAIPGADPAADADPGPARIWVDASDALIFLLHNPAVTGIQRVVLALIRHAMDHPEQMAPVLLRPWDGRIWALSRSAVAELLALAEAARGGGEEALSLIGRLYLTAREVAPAAGAALLRPGGFWTGGGNPPLHAALKRAGMRDVLLLHDLIPLTLPEHCVPALVREFAAVLPEELAAADAILANSGHTAEEVRAALTRAGLPQLPILPVPLAREALAAPPVLSRTVRRLGSRPFVLSVGTVESRKNHAFLVRIWERLRQEGVAMPLLVIAGKPGWRSGAWQEAMRETRAAGGLVRHVPKLSDGELAALYQRCLFTAFPSFGEGWGLPVGESLAHGKICIASDRGSLPEVGAGFALHVDPEDLEAALPLFRRLITDAPWRTELEARLRAGFRPRRWAEVAAEMAAAIEALPPLAPRPWSGPLLPPGTDWRVLPAALEPVPAQGPGVLRPPLRLMLAEGWGQPVEEEGAAPRPGPEAPLLFRTAIPGRISLQARALRGGAMAAGGCRLALAAGEEGEISLPLAAGVHRLPVTLEGDARLRRIRFAAEAAEG
ncbi:MAG: glycosyltransferase family 1 protein [Rhodovarius sp.]|nr:glycosyltransferase family 4 protein [Rhodovarius sp.]MCX7931252.1 glycosyltransferase family 4 protein [Rhodovarius sp.]MDW8315094.1 glycosyltransferase family 1 protein [Rhodovarius sp.]